MSHSKEINETSIRQLQITHVELKLYSDACSEPTTFTSPNFPLSHGFNLLRQTTSCLKGSSMALLLPKISARVKENRGREHVAIPKAP
jgi:hypothetical protein